MALLTGSILPGLAVQVESVSVCTDPDPPPWSYWQRDSQGHKTAELAGSSIEIVRAAFTHIGRTVEFHGEYPWARCLALVESGKMDFAMDAYFDTERAKRLAYSVGYNTLTPQVFYRAHAPVRIKVLADLKKYKGCGLVGASYLHYGLNPKDLDLGTGYAAMLSRLKHGRCDYFVEELEPIAGYKLLGTDYLADPDIRHEPVLGAKAPTKHLITSRKSDSARLLPALNAALEAMAKAGELERAWNRHAGGELPFRR